MRTPVGPDGKLKPWKRCPVCGCPRTGIAWTHHTFNPWIGCTCVSPACDLCYAWSLAEMRKWAKWGRGMKRRIMPEAYWTQPLTWNRKAGEAGGRCKVFCASMADVFDAEQPEILEPERQKLWDLIRQTPNLDWQLLTKRPNLINKTLPKDLWGAPNIWLGTSVETPLYYPRIKELIETPAVVHFISGEPVLARLRKIPLDGINWWIGGGESGTWFEGCKLTQEQIEDRRLVYKPGKVWLPKPDRLDWVREIRDQVVGAGIPFFWKQWGGPVNKSGGRTLDGVEWSELPKPRLL